MVKSAKYCFIYIKTALNSAVLSQTLLFSKFFPGTFYCRAIIEDITQIPDKFVSY